MEGASSLELLAELAVGVLGFSGIVVVLGQRVSGEWSSIDHRRFFSMIFVGALVIALTLLPLPFYYAGLEDEALWGWSSGIGAVLALLCNFAVLRTSPRAGLPAMYRDPSVSNVALVFGLLVTYGSPLILLLNAAGSFDRPFTPYLIAILMNFGLTLVTFVRLLQSAIRSTGPAV
jgi:hypothetical protein